MDYQAKSQERNFVKEAYNLKNRSNVFRTVNRVLKDQPNVKPHIISQVKKIAEELQYFPNQTAQSLKNNINNDIVFFIAKAKGKTKVEAE